MKNELFNIWKEAKTPTDYIIALWITTLALGVAVGSIAILFRLITDPSTFKV
jgi:hypothetical protein